MYVAGASSERETVAKPWMVKLIAAGVEITHDWTVDFLNVDTSSGGDELLTPRERHARAKTDLEGVQRADVFWMLAPSAKAFSGAWVEMGYALGLRDYATIQGNRPIVVVSGETRNATIFAELSCWSFPTHQAAFHEILRERQTMASLLAAP